MMWKTLVVTTLLLSVRSLTSADAQERTTDLFWDLQDIQRPGMFIFMMRPQKHQLPANL